MLRRTYVDSSVLIAAWRGGNPVGKRAMEILDDPGRQFLVSDFLRLEVLPKPRFHRKEDETQFMEAFLEAGEDIEATHALTQTALDLATRYGLSALDALHAAAALEARAQDLITVEKPDKPLCRVKELHVVSIAS